MKPKGLLMIEHRLIERMFKVVESEINRIKTEGKPDNIFIDMMVDFVRTYADRTHHGKEDDILFRDLAAKQMIPKDQQGMQKLTDDHIFARKTVKELVEVKDAYMSGDMGKIATIVNKLQTLADFYPEHIRLEDKEFFPATERYFSQQELDTMLDEFLEFDRRMIHEKYKLIIEKMEGK